MTKRFSSFITDGRLCFLVLAAMSCIAQAEQLPKWEVGVGLAGYIAPHYPGADQSADYVVPVPFLVYRGDKVEADRGGILGRLYDSAILDVRVSAGGSLPVNSEDNKARQGMPDLDLMLEAGPTLQFKVYQHNEHELRVDLPLRAAFSLGSSIDYRGLVFNPRLNYSWRLDGWRMSVTLGPVAATEKYHDYFYEVDSQYVRPWRPEFDASQGFMAWRSSLGLSRRFGQFYTGAFLNYMNLSDNRNASSPLIKKDDYLAFSVVFSWVFAHSDDFVQQ